MSYLSKHWFRIAVIIFCLNPLPLFSQLLTGKVSDSSTNKEIEGVVVTIKGTYLQSITDQQGNFSIAGSGDSIIFTHISYIPVTVSSKGPLNIQMTRKTYLSEEVTISGSRADRKSAVAYNDLNKSDIEKKNDGKDFPFLLNSLPSVVVTSDAGTGVGYTGIRIRGSDASRVNVTINGVPVNDAESHQVYWVDLPDIASSVENVQVQRGLGNSTTGAGAFGGSINVLTNKFSPEAYGLVSSSAGSFNTFRNTVSFGSGLLSNAFAIEGRLSKISSDGYIDRASSDLKSYYLNAGYYGAKNSLRFVTFSGKEKTYQAWYGVPQDSLNTNRTYNPAGEYYDENGNVHYYDNQTDNYQQDYYQLLYSHSFDDNLILNSTLYYTHGEGYYEEYKPGEDLSSYHLSDTSLYADLIRRLWLSNDLYGANASVEYSKQSVKVQVGLSGNYYDGDHFNEVIASEVMPLTVYPFQYYQNKAYKTDLSGYIKAIYSISSRLDMTVDLQQRHIEYSYQGYDEVLSSTRLKDKLNFFNPKIGLNYSPANNMQLYVYGGIGHKEPVRDDYINAAPTDVLSPEKMIDAEAGTKINSAKASFGLNAYYMYYDNQLILTGKINDVGEYIRQNVPKSYRMGIEAEGEANLSPVFFVKANATFSTNKIKLYKEYVYDYDVFVEVVNEYKNTPIAFSPSITGFGEVGAKIVRGLTAELTGKYVSKQYLDNTGSDARSIDPYFVSDFHLSYSLKPRKLKEITLRFSLYNLTATKYSANGYTYSDYSGQVRNDYNFYFPQAMTNWSGGVVVKF